MTFRSLKFIVALVAAVCLLPACDQQPPASSVEKPAEQQQDPLADWQPEFDPSGADYVYTLSNVDHPAIAGIAVGYHIRDEVWKRSNGRLYVDFRPLAQLGGEKDVISKLKLGAVQGMLCSSVAAVNVADRLGLVNLPFVVDTFAKLEQFRNDEQLFREYGATAEAQGIKVVDFTGYGSYGWATETPVRSLEEAGKINFRIAQAPVNADTYKSWGLKFTVMPWPDVPQALQTGVVTGLDHTPIVCSITHKFDMVENFTQLDYAQGLYIHLMNRRWFEKLPQDLQTILLEVITEESAKARKLTRQQQQRQIAEAEAQGVKFWSFPDEERQRLIELSEPVYDKWRPRIGDEFLARVRRQL
nr:TRAP transporter substrate-binding protein [Desulfuromonadales bacterium]